MALHTVSNLKDSVAGLLSGVDLGTVDDLNGALERAARTLVQNADVPEASGIQRVILYAGVYDYACDTRIFGTAINDIRPQGISRNPWDFVVKTDQETFDRTKGYYPSGTMSTFQYNMGVPVIRIKAPFPQQQLIIDGMSQTDGWTAGGDASGLVQDQTFYYHAPGSLRFNLAAAGSSGYLEKTLQSPIDMTQYLGVGVVFLAAELPTATDFTNLKVRLGSDSANYYEVSVATGFLGSWSSGVFELSAFDLANATTVGAPDISAIQYVRCIADYDGTAQANVRFGDLFVSLPSPAEILYQSAAIYKNGTNPVSTSITSNDDVIILNDPAYNIYLYESAYAVLENTGASASDATSIKIFSKLNGSGTNPGLYAMFRGDNPSQELRTLGSWYSGSSYNNGNYGTGLY